MSSTRRGVYLSEREAAELERIAAASNLTPSSVLRVGLRMLAGLPVGPAGQQVHLACPDR